MKKPWIRALFAFGVLILALYLAFASVCISGYMKDREGLDSGERLLGGIGEFVKTGLKDNIKRFSYVFNKKIDTEYVVSGEGGFLFPVKTDSFDYEGDMKGNMGFSDSELMEISDALAARHTAYEKKGAEYLLVIIPNSQTVYPSLCPFEKQGQTRLEGLMAYLEKSGADYVYSPTDLLANAAVSAYNNTENSINEYGAYLIYQYVSGMLPESLEKRSLPVELKEDDFEKYSTTGKGLAALIEMEGVLKNNTVVLKEGALEQRYEESEVSDIYAAFSLKAEYNPFIGSSAAVLDIPYSEERGLLLRYFSSAYTDTVYKYNFEYSPSVTERYSPAVAVQFIREDDLSSLLDDDAALGYIESYDPDSAERTDTPTVESFSDMTSSSVLIAGYCEEGARITLTDGEETVTVDSRDGLYIAEFRVKGFASVTVYAECDGKRRSEGATVRVSTSGRKTDHAYIGSSSMLYYFQTVNDFTGKSLLSDKEKAKTKKVYESTLEKVRKASGKDTEMILLIAPNPLTIYPEAANAKHSASMADYTKRMQMAQILEKSEGITVLDIADYMKTYSDAGKLYYQTDTHWTETGAFFGYTALMNEIAKKFPNAAPYSMNMFEEVVCMAPGGDLAGFTRLREIQEKVTFLVPKYEARSIGWPEKPLTVDRPEAAEGFVSHAEGEGLPTAVLMRDSYSAQMLPHLCEHFATLDAAAMWEYIPDYEKIEALKPDYIIIIICERNLPALF